MELFPLILTFLSTGLHASWNLIARSQRSTDFFLRLSLLITAIALAPTVLAEIYDAHILSAVWRQLIVAGCFQSIYYLGLSRGYMTGDFAVVYPLSRAAPVLAIAILDVARGEAPTFFGWLGLALTAIGCVLAPLTSLQDFTLARYWNKTSLWIALAAIGTIGYTAADSDAAKLIASGPIAAIRYQVFEISIATIAYTSILVVLRTPIRVKGGWSDWRPVGIAAAGLFFSYVLILWAYQFSTPASYILAIRQLGVVLGVAAAAILVREPAARFRLVAASLITAGIICIGLGG